MQTIKIDVMLDAAWTGVMASWHQKEPVEGILAFGWKASLAVAFGFFPHMLKLGCT